MKSVFSLVVALSHSMIPAPQPSHYDVTFPTSAGTSASVVASIDVNGEFLHMRNGGNDLPQGFATFVTLKQVRDEQGQNVGFQRDSVSQWKLARKVARATLTYDIDFSFARKDWPSGNEQAAQWKNGALYTVTKPLFVTGAGDTPSDVVFHLPTGWKIATPWKPVAGKQNEFSVSSEPSLTDNSIVVGQFRSDTFTTGPFTFTLATLGETVSTSAMMSRVLRLVAREYVRVFPSTRPTSYLMTVFQGLEDDGEAFAQSFAFRTHDIPTQANGIMWGTTLAHELFHFWNGSMMRGTDEVASAWFSEGITEYYANRKLLRTGALPPSLFLSKAEKMAGLYEYFRTQPMFDSVSLSAAGSRRTRYRFGVYNGGWAVGFALDREIARATSGRSNLDDVMREIFSTHSDVNTPFSVAEVVAITSRVAGKNMKPFFDKFVDGRDLLPMTELFHELGINADFISYTGEGYFRFSRNPTPRQVADWNRYSGNKPRR
jgi:predicted metalloprotease with PDZ domain